MNSRKDILAAIDEIQSELDTIDAARRRLGRRFATLRVCMEEIAPRRSAAPSSRVVHIQETVAAHFGFTRARILQGDKPGPIVAARSAAMALCRELTHRSLPGIAMDFLKKDHGSVIHAIKVIRDRETTDPAFAKQMQTLRAKLHEELPQIAALPVAA